MIRWLWSKMMKWGWDFTHDIRGQHNVVSSDTVESRSDIRIGILKAMNGKVLEISKRNNNNGIHVGHEWNHTLFLVPEDMTLTDAITTLLIAEGLNK
jgi:hypothetical protein